MVFPTRVRRRVLRHAFEDALEDARDGNGETLDELLSPDTDAGDGAAQRFQSSLEDVPGLADATGYVPAQSLAAVYGAEMGSAEQAERTLSPRRAADRLAAIVRRGVSRAELQRLRRSFAAQNHPDRVPPDLRAEAETAMAFINAEIDAALKRAPTDVA